VPVEQGAAPSTPQALARSKSARLMHSAASKAGVMLVGGSAGLRSTPPEASPKISRCWDRSRGCGARLA
jgi:hypothetical protein